jgi:putative transposase
VAARVDYAAEATAVFTVAELERWFAVAIIDYYHRKPHAGLGVPPLVQYHDGLQQRATLLGQPYPRRLDDGRTFMLDFLPVVWRTLQRHGFMVDHIAYYSETFRPLIGDTRHGKFLIRRDPRDLSRVYVWEPTSQQYVDVPCRTYPDR